MIYKFIPQYTGENSQDGPDTLCDYFNQCIFIDLFTCLI